MERGGQAGTESATPTPACGVKRLWDPPTGQVAEGDNGTETTREIPLSSGHHLLFCRHVQEEACVLKGMSLPPTFLILHMFFIHRSVPV